MSFNIDKIIKECPRAWEGCIRFFIHQHNYEALEFKYNWNPNTNRIEIWEGDYLDLEIHPRELYDFFGSVGIILTIGFERKRDSTAFKKYVVQGWQKCDDGGAFCIATTKKLKLIIKGGLTNGTK